MVAAGRSVWSSLLPPALRSATFCAVSWSCTYIVWAPTPRLMVRGERPDRKSLICRIEKVTSEINGQSLRFCWHSCILWQQQGNDFVRNKTEEQHGVSVNSTASWTHFVFMNISVYMDILNYMSSNVCVWGGFCMTVSNQVWNAFVQDVCMCMHVFLETLKQECVCFSFPLTAQSYSCSINTMQLHFLRMSYLKETPHSCIQQVLITEWHWKYVYLTLISGKLSKTSIMVLSALAVEHCSTKISTWHH